MLGISLGLSSLAYANTSNNHPPSLGAPSELKAKVGEQVTILASAGDPDGDQLFILWNLLSRPAGSQAVLLFNASLGPKFTPDVAGVYLVQGMVSDGKGGFASTQVKVTAGVTAGGCTFPVDGPQPPFQVVPTALDSQGNHNGVLDTAEILTAVADWQTGTLIDCVTIDTNLMLQLVAAWLNQTPIGSQNPLMSPSPEAAQALAELMGTTADQPLAVQEVLTTPTAGAVSFTVLGQGVASIEVRVFTLSGELVYSSGEVAGNALRWDLLSNDGQPVANGVYLYVVTAHGFNGNSVTTKVNKLVVLR